MFAARRTKAEAQAPTTSETGTFVVPASPPGQRELPITRESVATLSRLDGERALRYTSGASLEYGSKPQLASPEMLALLWRRIDEIVRQEVGARGAFYKVRQPDEAIDQMLNIDCLQQNQPPLATERTSGQGRGIAPSIDRSRTKR